MSHTHNRLAARSRDRRGFTLIEMIVSIVVGVIISGVAAMLVGNSAKLRTEVAARAELVDVAARACEQMLRYVREIPQDAGLTGQAQISTATATELRFGTNGFRLSSDTLEMTVDSGVSWHPLTRDVSSFAVSYFDSGGTGLSAFPLSQANREAVRVVRINIELTRGVETRAVQTSVYLRSFLNEVTNDP